MPQKPRNYALEYQKRVLRGMVTGKTHAEARGHAAQERPQQVRHVLADRSVVEQWVAGPTPPDLKRYAGAEPADIATIRRAERHMTGRYVRVACLGAISEEFAYGFGRTGDLQWRSVRVRRDELEAVLDGQILHGATAEEMASLLFGYDWDEVLAWSFAESPATPLVTGPRSTNANPGNAP